MTDVQETQGLWRAHSVCGTQPTWVEEPGAGTCHYQQRSVLWEPSDWGMGLLLILLS